MPITITDLTVHDLRFPTSTQLDGSDAMNPDPDYSAAYCILHTNHPGLAGHGMTFTIGRGNDLCCRAIEALRGLVVGDSLESIAADMRGFWRRVTGDSQLRWVGPEKGVIHLATAAVVNAVWDLYAKAEGKPLWQLLAEMSPEQLVNCVDFRYITDALTPDEALDILQRWAPTRPERIAQLQAEGYPAYTTSAGWLGYSDDKLRELCRQSLADGWNCFKIKVGRDLEDDVRRCRIIREEIGWDRRMMVDANQVWDVGQAIEWMRYLAPF
ncbi:MAG: enolase C-terminal domain-like protein, partial [Aureliella sp.]